MASFFGMTKLGTRHLFDVSSRRRELEDKPKPKRRSIASVPVDDFIAAFEARASHNLSHTVRAVQLPEIVERCVGRKLDPRELELFLRHFDIRAGNIRLDEFRRGLQRFHAEQDHAIQFAERAKTPVKQTGEDLARFGRYSHLQLKDRRRRDTRNDFGPMDVLQYPLTANQQYGWGIDTRVRAGDVFRPHSSTDVTRSEGICLASYYLV
ncbi:uncharacterized protein LOC9629206 isoform X1 [Selaginella moellendorffii]|uniref:uncharacterized protein LOC9629206 isoform X1 n=1 Tax=Selaginella moellendorffii TaxID=88036 RepID=UPI000D1CB896|nr:uncharacterized protein LOC9629206 isoform X1 [Selaginella moellendorffii]|eukprot:XP_024521951.1 uncharacterized protein LOC9629206 isoform X1 [Selaginella moellendorffii]